MAQQGDRTVETLVEAVHEMRADLDGPTIPWTVLSVLEHLVPTQELAFMVMDRRRRRFLSHQCIEGSVRLTLGDADVISGRWCSVAATAVATADPALSGPGRIERWTAAYGRFQSRLGPLPREHHRGVGDVLSLGFPALPGYARLLLLWRNQPEKFSPVDEGLLRLLRPHLFEIDGHARRRREPSAGLTSREWQVLELVAQGASNAEVAAALVTSVATVRKHMEHIFDRSGVRTRSAAVARLMPARAAESEQRE